jgi:hypothetical protein
MQQSMHEAMDIAVMVVLIAARTGMHVCSRSGNRKRLSGITGTVGMPRAIGTKYQLEV